MKNLRPFSAGIALSLLSVLSACTNKLEVSKEQAKKEDSKNLVGSLGGLNAVSVGSGSNSYEPVPLTALITPSTADIPQARSPDSTGPNLTDLVVQKIFYTTTDGQENQLPESVPQLYVNGVSATYTNANLGDSKVDVFDFTIGQFSDTCKINAQLTVGKVRLSPDSPATSMAAITKIHFSGGDTCPLVSSETNKTKPIGVDQKKLLSTFDQASIPMVLIPAETSILDAQTVQILIHIPALFGTAMGVTQGRIILTSKANSGLAEIKCDTKSPYDLYQAALSSQYGMGDQGWAELAFTPYVPSRDRLWACIPTEKFVSDSGNVCDPSSVTNLISPDLAKVKQTLADQQVLTDPYCKSSYGSPSNPFPGTASGAYLQMMTGGFSIASITSDQVPKNQVGPLNYGYPEDHYLYKPNGPSGSTVYEGALYRYPYGFGANFDPSSGKPIQVRDMGPCESTTLKDGTPALFCQKGNLDAAAQAVQAPPADPNVK